MAAKLRNSKKLFISHSAKDRSFVTKLTRFLRSHRIPYWYSAHHIAGAKQWHDEIGTALGECKWFLIVLSPKSVKSMWVKRELLYALQSNRYDGRIIPVLLKKCAHGKLSWTLSGFQFVNFGKNFKEGCEQLLNALA